MYHPEIHARTVFEKTSAESFISNEPAFEPALFICAGAVYEVPVPVLVSYHSPKLQDSTTIMLAEGLLHASLPGSGLCIIEKH
jgi:hypothetical protein